MGAIKNIAAGAASFIPGVGPIASAALGALGGSGKSKQQQQTKQTESIDMTNNVDMFDEAIEDPTFANARTSLIPLLQQQMRKANQPVYGDPQKAAFLNNLNDLAEGAMTSLKGSLASTGRLDSGGLGSGIADIQRERLGQASGFFSQLPFMEQQAQAERMNPLLNMATNWVGRAPISTRRTGTTTEKGTRTTEGNMTGTSQGPGFLRQFAGNLGGMGLGSSMGKLPTMADMFRRSQGGPHNDWGDYSG